MIFREIVNSHKTTLADSGSEEESSIEANTEVSTEGSGEESTAEEMSTETATEAVETEIIETEEEKELETLENTVEEPVAQVDGAEEYGTLENGDFEAIDDNGYGTTTPFSKNYGMAGALSVLLFIVTGILSMIVYKVSNSNND